VFFFFFYSTYFIKNQKKVCGKNTTIKNYQILAALFMAYIMPNYNQAVIIKPKDLHSKIFEIKNFKNFLKGHSLHYEKYSKICCEFIRIPWGLHRKVCNEILDHVHGSIYLTPI